jgi:site-specific DNA recombinase
MSTSAITYRLRELTVPTKCGGLWCRAAVLNILKNPAYIGKTYAFTTINGRPFSRKQDEWIEIPDATPAIIDKGLFDAAQKQLQLNRQKSGRNVKRQYLLRGHISCKRCGRTYYSGFTYDRYGSERIATRRYRCTGKLRMVQPVNRCDNRSWKADNLETLVWEQIQRVLEKPELVITELEKQRQDADRAGVLETELKQAERQLKALDREQAQLLQWAIKGFPEETVLAENKKINTRRESLKAHKAELEAQIKASQDAAISLPKLERFVELMREKLTTLDYETKRLALDMLNIKVWLDGHNVEITGTLPITDDVIVTMQS